MYRLSSDRSAYGMTNFPCKTAGLAKFSGDDKLAHLSRLPECQRSVANVYKVFTKTSMTIYMYELYALTSHCMHSSLVTNIARNEPYIFSATCLHCTCIYTIHTETQEVPNPYIHRICLHISVYSVQPMHCCSLCCSLYMMKMQ